MNGSTERAPSMRNVTARRYLEADGPRTLADHPCVTVEVRAVSSKTVGEFGVRRPGLVQRG